MFIYEGRPRETMSTMKQRPSAPPQMTTSFFGARLRRRVKLLSAATNIYWPNQVMPASKY
jgi:hypothetical protein